MGTRNKTNQLKHNKMVLEIVKAAIKKGVYKNNIWADLKKFNKPPKIGGYIPDIKIKEKEKIHFIEVETPETLKEDKPQRDAFRKYANNNPNVTFKTLVTKIKGK